MKDNWMIYGANGYTGALIAEAAVASSMQKPVLAGRNRQQIEAIAKRLQCESRIFDLPVDSARSTTVSEHIKDCRLVLHCAGPFVFTSEPMARSCVATGTAYLDITGEVPVFQMLHSLDAEARRAKTLLLPGVGFDIVPTDCMARSLAERLPGAVSLRLAFAGLSQISAGTMRSALIGLTSDSLVRRDGELVPVPYFSRRIQLDLMDRKETYSAIPWGDVFTAHISTGIPNIEVYTKVSGSQRLLFSLLQSMRGLLGIALARRMYDSLGRSLSFIVTGPDETIRRTSRARIEGLVIDGMGHSLRARLETPEGYAFTVQSSLAAVRRVLDGRIEKLHRIGFQTPSLAFGSNFVFEVDGVRWM